MDTFFKYFWLVAIVVNGINAVISWVRVQPYIQKKPEHRLGYLKLIRGYVVGTNIPWIVMGIGMTIGGISNIADYFYPRSGNLFVISWWISLWSLILLLSYWIWFRGGAEQLTKYPGLLKGNPTNPGKIKLI